MVSSQKEGSSTCSYASPMVRSEMGIRAKAPCVIYPAPPMREWSFLDLVIAVALGVAAGGVAAGVTLSALGFF